MASASESLFDDVGWRAGANDDRTKLRKSDLVPEFKRCWHVLERVQAFLTEQQNGAHLLAVQELGNVPGLFVERVGVTPEDRDVTLAWLREGHLDDLDAAAVEHGQ